MIKHNDISGNFTVFTFEEEWQFTESKMFIFAIFDSQNESSRWLQFCEHREIQK